MADLLAPPHCETTRQRASALRSLEGTYLGGRLACGEGSRLASLRVGLLQPPWRPESWAGRDTYEYPGNVLIAWIATHVAVTVVSTLVLPVMVLTAMGLGQSKPQSTRGASDSPH